MNYCFSADHHNGRIDETDEPVDGDTIFATFTEAREGLAQWFLFVSDAYRSAAREARRLRKKDMTADGITTRPV